MSEPYLSEIRIVSFNFAPRGWAFCNGQTLPINQNQALFSLMGTTYGGNGLTTFQLPNLQGQVPVHMGAGPGLSVYTLGQAGGEASHTLNVGELPQHSHAVSASSAGANLQAPTNHYWAAPSTSSYSAHKGALMNAATIPAQGGSQPHYNLPPYLVVNFIIALVGIFPSHN